MLAGMAYLSQYLPQTSYILSVPEANVLAGIRKSTGPFKSFVLADAMNTQISITG